MVIVEDVNVVIHANMHQTENVMMVELVQTTTFVASAQTAKIATIRFHHRRIHEYFSKRNHCRFFENQPASNLDLMPPLPALSVANHMLHRYKIDIFNQMDALIVLRAPAIASYALRSSSFPRSVNESGEIK